MSKKFNLPMPNSYFKGDKKIMDDVFIKFVEHGCSFKEAADELKINKMTVDNYVKSLQIFLNKELFIKTDEYFSLTKDGYEYYKTIKTKDCKTFEEIKEIEENRRKKKSSILKKKNEYYIKKIILLTFLTIISGIWLYLYQTNWFFDKKLRKMASPLLREIIQKDYHRIDKNTFCSFEPMQFHLDINKLLLILLEKKYNIKITCLTVNENPGTPMRMNGKEEIDSVFKNKDAIKCDTERRYKALNTRYKQKIAMMEMNKNTQLYNFYEKEDGKNYNIFFENVKRYPNQLFGIKIELNHFPLNTGKYWIITYDNYYYLFLESNGLQGQNQNLMQERYLIFKKLTLDELIHYDNGSYWKLIKEYDVKID